MTSQDPAEMKLHEDAERHARRKIDDFGAALIYESKLVAFREQANEVQTPHVDSALDTLNRAKSGGWKQNFLTLMGGTLLGTSLDGLIAQYSANNAGLLLTYSIIGFGALILVFLGLRK